MSQNLAETPLNLDSKLPVGLIGWARLPESPGTRTSKIQLDRGRGRPFHSRPSLSMGLMRWMVGLTELESVTSCVSIGKPVGSRVPGYGLALSDVNLCTISVQSP